MGLTETAGLGVMAGVLVIWIVAAWAAYIAIRRSNR